MLVLPRWRDRPARRRTPAFFLALVVLSAVVTLSAVVVRYPVPFRVVIFVLGAAATYLGVCRYAFERRRRSDHS